LSLQAVAVLDLSFPLHQGNLDTWGCAGAVAPAEGQQRLYQRAFSRLLELLLAPLKSFIQQTTL
jgi:hypothetical protein